MKLPLRYFVIISILLGAVAIPVGWRSYQKWKVDEWKAEETERLKKELAELLEKELAELRENEPVLVIWNWIRYVKNPAHETWQSRVKKLEDRLEKLTGVRPSRPEPPPGGGVDTM